MEEVGANWKRGLIAVRRMTDEQFGKLFNNIFGFEVAYLCWSNHHVWGAVNDDGIRILEITVNLDSVENSYLIDKSTPKPQLVINDEFIERIKWLFFAFYDVAKNAEFNKNSDLAPELEGIAEFDWVTPEVIVIYLDFNIDGQPQTFPIMENSMLWLLDEDEVKFDDSKEYFDYCSGNYSRFLGEYAKYFDMDGNPLVR